MADFTFSESGNTRTKKLNLQKAGVSIDMTTIVDIIMILHTFFMLTSTLATPQVMQINLPKGEEPVAINMGNVLFIRVSEKGNVYFSQGLESGAEMPPEKISFANMGGRLTQLSKANSDLLLILK